MATEITIPTIWLVLPILAVMIVVYCWLSWKFVKWASGHILRMSADYTIKWNRRRGASETQINELRKFLARYVPDLRPKD